MVARALNRRASERPLLPPRERFSAGHNLCRPRWVFEGLVRSDRVVDDAESADLRVQGVAVGDHTAE